MRTIVHTTTRIRTRIATYMYHVTWLVPVMVTKGTLVRVSEFFTHKPVTENVTVAGCGGCQVGSLTLLTLLLLLSVVESQILP